MENRKLCKARENRIFCGVCAGLAQYFQIDVTLVRLVFAALAIIGGSGVLLYLAATVIMPEEA